jgi:hypothetical protein
MANYRGTKVWLNFHGLLKFGRMFRVSCPAFFERCSPLRRSAAARRLIMCHIEK